MILCDISFVLWEFDRMLIHRKCVSVCVRCTLVSYHISFVLSFVYSLINIYNNNIQNDSSGFSFIHETHVRRDAISSKLELN